MTTARSHAPRLLLFAQSGSRCVSRASPLPFVRSSSEPHDRVLVVQYARAGCPATATSNDSKHRGEATPAGLGRRSAYDAGRTRRLSIWNSVLSPRMPIRPGPLSGGAAHLAMVGHPERNLAVPDHLDRHGAVGVVAGDTADALPLPDPRRSADRRTEQEVAAALNVRLAPAHSELAPGTFFWT